MSDIPWRKKKRTLGREVVPSTYKWDTALKQAMQELEEEEGISETTLIENLMLRNGKAFIAVRKQLKERVKALGGNQNESTTS